jgi:hypothetical protein
MTQCTENEIAQALQRSPPSTKHAYANAIRYKREFIPARNDHVAVANECYATAHLPSCKHLLSPPLVRAPSMPDPGFLQNT